MTVASEWERGISKILHDHWDPLGVRGFPRTEDEYDEHARELAPWLQSGKATFEELRQYLDDAAYSHSVTWDDNGALDHTARLLLALRPET